MPNFINGSRLKKYELPLTEDILRKLHMSKTYKEGQAQLKVEAQREARERWEKIKKRQANMTTTIKTNLMDQMFYLFPFVCNFLLLQM